MRGRKDRVDDNQKDIVDRLRKIPGVTVELDKDDILVGCMDKDCIPRTYWIEIKNPNTVSKKTGEVLPSAIKKSQKNIVKKWTGQYDICVTFEDVLKVIGLK